MSKLGFTNRYVMAVVESSRDPGMSLPVFVTGIAPRMPGYSARWSPRSTSVARPTARACATGERPFGSRCTICTRENNG